MVDEEKDMITNKIPIKIVDNPSLAPNYKKGEIEPLLIKKCIVVGKGTESNKPTVDLQLVDTKGNKYLIMTTGALMEMLGSVCAGKRQRDVFLKGKH